MIKHIVMWKVKDNHNGKDKKELMIELQARLVSLKETIKEIKEMEVGMNFNPSEAAFDVVLYSVFDSKDALQGYQKHPDHVKVAEYVGEIRTARAVVDYEI